MMRLAPLLFLAACATASQTHLSDGRVGHVINCPGTANNWGRCYEKAGEICGSKGYDVQNQSGDQGHFVTGSATPSGGTVVGGSTISRTLIVACKP